MLVDDVDVADADVAPVVVVAACAAVVRRMWDMLDVEKTSPVMMFQEAKVVDMAETDAGSG
jgi:hypothetical protein